MRFALATSALALCSSVQANILKRDHDVNDYFAIELSPSASPVDVARSLGAEYEGPLGTLPNHHTFSTRKESGTGIVETLDGLRVRRRKRALSQDVEERDFATELDGIVWSHKIQMRPRMEKRRPPPLPQGETPRAREDPAPTPEQLEAQAKQDLIATTLGIQDPIFKDQWHLFNTREVGHDINVTGLWLEGITGEGSITAIVDDGLDLHSDDLKDNFYAPGSWDFNDKGPEPLPRLFDDKHGTRCSGEIGAGKNNICGLGVAYDGKISGIRILSKQISDEDEALSINYHFNENDIYSCSWGPPDDGATMEGPDVLIKRALVSGVQQGRGGKGSIFVFAAGNGAGSGDNCNFDGYTNSIYSITVGAIDHKGNHPYYSEACSAQMVVTYSSGDGEAIHTTDVGTDKCYSGHGGTSAAGPLVAGISALALSVRPDLTWRDVQYLCLLTAIPIHLEDGEWQDTPLGKKFSHQYGYGKVDAYSLVQLAKEWTLVKPQAWLHSPWLRVNHPIPQGDQGLISAFEVTKEMLQEANLERIEHVTVTMNVNHTRRGDLSVELRGPQGIVSHLSVPRKLDNDKNGYVDWTFMSVAHWGEEGIGKWTVVVKDTNVNDFTGTFTDWRLNLWGEAIDGTNQPLRPFPTEHDDDHEATTVTAPVATTSVGSAPTNSVLPAKPSDHPDRPTKPKPGNSDTEEEVDNGKATATATAASTTTATSSATETASNAADHFLPSFFPTFGVSKRTQIWIYGSIGLIIVFCSGLGIYVFMQRRKRRLNNPHDDYEFEIVNDHEEGEGLTAGLGKEKRASKRRAGELYDAFAGESDEELFSEEEESDSGERIGGTYRDEPEEQGLRSGEKNRGRDSLSD